MNIDIRKSIINNFTNTSKEEIIKSINDSLKEQDEITLPGMGVFFEIIWQNSNKDLKNELIDIITNNL